MTISTPPFGQCVSPFGMATTTGEERFVERIGGGKMGFTASLVACGDKLYATGEAGEIHVMKVGDTYTLQRMRVDTVDPVGNRVVGMTYLEFEKPKRTAPRPGGLR